MSMAACFFSTPSFSLSNDSNSVLPKLNLSPPSPLRLTLRNAPFPAATTIASVKSLSHRRHQHSSFLLFASSGGDNNDGNNNDDNNNNNNNNNNNGGDGNGDENAGDKNRKEAIMMLAEAKRSVESLPKDLVAAIEAGRIPGSVIKRYFELEKTGLFKWLMQFDGFRERLLADDLFLAKVGMECGVGIFTKTAAEYDKRRENFFKEIEIVTADVVMAIIADFMLVYLPAPTISLRPAAAASAGAISKFFQNCPDNAFQIALSGSSYSLLQRMGAVVRNGAKLFAVGTASSLIGTAITNAVINARKAVSTNGEAENVPILSTSVAYGVYMAVSSNLRYQIVAGVFEQRILEPIFHRQKLILSALCFAVRTGNTYLGSLLWVDYARLVGIQKAHEEEKAVV